MLQQTDGSAYLDSWNSACRSSMSRLHSTLLVEQTCEGPSLGIQHSTESCFILWLTKQWSGCNRRLQTVWWLVNRHYSKLEMKLNREWYDCLDVLCSSVSPFMHVQSVDFPSWQLNNICQLLLQLFLNCAFLVTSGQGCNKCQSRVVQLINKFLQRNVFTVFNVITPSWI